MPSFTNQIHLGDKCPDHIKDVGADLGAGMCELVEGIVHGVSRDLPPRWKEMKTEGCALHESGKGGQVGEMGGD